MSMEGKKVLHIDKNSYYGGDITSVNIDSLFQYFNVETDVSKYHRAKDWNVDLVSKFLMANGT